MAKGEKSAATVTIHWASDMSYKGRRRVAQWLVRQSKFLMKEAKHMPPRFTAKYLYRPEA